MFTDRDDRCRVSERSGCHPVQPGHLAEDAGCPPDCSFHSHPEIPARHGAARCVSMVVVTVVFDDVVVVWFDGCVCDGNS